MKIVLVEENNKNNVTFNILRMFRNIDLLHHV